MTPAGEAVLIRCDILIEGLETRMLDPLGPADVKALREVYLPDNVKLLDSMKAGILACHREDVPGPSADGSLIQAWPGDRHGRGSSV